MVGLLWVLCGAQFMLVLDTTIVTVAKRLTRLEARGLVSRRLDPGDRRSLLAALTEQGRALTAKAVVAHTRASAALADSLSATDRARLTGLLRKLLLHQES